MLHGTPGFWTVCIFLGEEEKLGLLLLLSAAPAVHSSRPWQDHPHLPFLLHSRQRFPRWGLRPACAGEAMPLMPQPWALFPLLSSWTPDAHPSSSCTGLGSRRSCLGLSSVVRSQVLICPLHAMSFCPFLCPQELYPPPFYRRLCALACPH